MNKSLVQAIITPKTALAIITAAWILVQLVAWLHFDVKTGVDTSAYVADAMAIINGDWPAIELPLHVSYSLLLAIVITITGNFVYVVVVQLMLSLLAVLMLYRLTFAISENRFTAFITGLLFVVWPDISQWNFFVYTDSVFTSLVVISITQFHFSKRPVQYILAIVLVVFTMLMRPVGVVLFLSLLVYLFDRIKTTMPKKLIASTFVIVGLIMVNFILRRSIDSFLSSYKEAEIIYPHINVGVQAPDDLAIPASHHQPVVRILLFVLNNPGYFLKLFVLKIALFVGHVKPYFSITHNILIGIFLYPLYILVVPGVMSLKQTAFRSFAVSFILLQVVMVGLTSENWDGRFLLPILPWVFLLSSFGITKILRNRISLVPS